MDGATRADTPAKSPTRSQKRTFVGLQFRFTVLMLVLAFTAIALVGGVLVNLAGQLASGQKHDQCLQLASLLAKSAGDLLQAGDTDALQELAERFIVEDGPVFVALTDSSGRVAAACDAQGRRLETLPDPAAEDGRTILGVPTFVPTAPGWDAHVQVTYPINATGPDESGNRRLLGYARVGLGVQNTMRDLTAAIDLFSGISVALLVLIFPLTYVVVHRVVMAINELSWVVRCFANGDLMPGVRSAETTRSGNWLRRFTPWPGNSAASTRRSSPSMPTWKSVSSGGPASCASWPRANR